MPNLFCDAPTGLVSHRNIRNVEGSIDVPISCFRQSNYTVIYFLKSERKPQFFMIVPKSRLSGT